MPPGVQELSAVGQQPDSVLKLLLFVDRRPGAQELIRQARSLLERLGSGLQMELEVVDICEQPYLVEHFKLVATPALVKINPSPRQTLAGNNLVYQIEHWWPRWQQELVEASSDGASLDQGKREADSLAASAQVLRLSDELFRLQQEKEELQQQLAFKDRILAMLAHDLRNPLTAASIALETIELSGDRLTPQLMAQMVRHARTQTKAMNRMITDILQAARGTSAEFTIAACQFDITHLCKEVLLHLRNRFDSKQQTIEEDLPTDLPLVYADTERIRQVLINLLDNASKYTPAGGTIQMRAMHRTTQKVQISVGDNGPGIPEENRERIFEDQFRLKRDEAQDGYGIGLSLCRRIIRAHYGQIWVDSVPGCGSSFHFTLPVFDQKRSTQ
ncbi:histidine kinase [Leptolyngbya sp. FACHB-261]|nr:histidine kinase [Leptolyngbya sp. FACHB-261]